MCPNHPADRASGEVDDVARLVDWTGERCVPWMDDLQVIYEHLHRYRFALPIVRDRRVLELGSGEGYGSAALADVAEHVTAVESDPIAVEHARLNYPAANLEFRCASILELDDLPDGSFDVVVCFEMVEHIEQHDELLTLSKRLLTPTGVLVAATPDRLARTEATGNDIPDHVKELGTAEFTGLLQGSFDHVAIWAQSVVTGSVLQRIDTGRAGTGAGTEQIVVGRRGDRWMERTDYRPPYVLGVASMHGLPELPGLSVFNQPDSGVLDGTPHAEEAGGGFTELWSPERLQRQVVIYEAALREAMDGHRDAATLVDQLNHHVVAIERASLALQSDAIRQERRAADAEREVAAVRARLDQIESSRAWRIVTRLRSTRRRVGLTWQRPDTGP